jgi:integrase
VRTVESLRSGRYKVRFRHGQKQTSETFDKRKDAEQFATWLDALGAQGALDLLYENEQDKTVQTLNELAADHFKHLSGVTLGTRLTYERLWARTWGPIIGATRAHRLTRDQVALALNDLGERYSRKSLENQRGMLAGVLGRAVDNGWQTKNIARGLRLPDGQPSRGSDEMRILTPDEFAYVEGEMDAAYRSLIRVLWGTGCRWGEAVVLPKQKWHRPNISFHQALKWSPDNQRVIGAPKTSKSRRTVLAPAEIHDELDELCVGRGASDFIFTAKRGGMVLHRTFWSRYWLPAVSGLDGPRPRIHDLRHSHASWLLGQGVPIHVVQARLGHESIQTTVDTYSHLLPDAQLGAANAAALAFTAVPKALAPPLATV